MSGNHPVTRMFRGHAWEQNDNTSDLPKIFIQLAPVSYTHLDVYKRQSGY